MNIPVSNLTKEITVNVRIIGFKGWKVRMKVAKCLIWLAGKIAGMGFRIED